MRKLIENVISISLEYIFQKSLSIQGKSPNPFIKNILKQLIRCDIHNIFLYSIYLVSPLATGDPKWIVAPKPKTPLLSVLCQFPPFGHMQLLWWLRPSSNISDGPLDDDSFGILILSFLFRGPRLPWNILTDARFHTKSNVIIVLASSLLKHK